MLVDRGFELLTPILEGWQLRSELKNAPSADPRAERPSFEGSEVTIDRCLDFAGLSLNRDVPLQIRCGETFLVAELLTELGSRCTRVRRLSEATNPVTIPRLVEWISARGRAY